ncbi:MAG: hypothetical protein ACT4QD_26850 [Acidobacteriota bacterium]
MGELVLLLSYLVRAPLPQPGAQTDDWLVVSTRVEQRAERFDYHIENPSNVEPGPLVPHFFEQHYDSGSTWVAVRADYRLFGSGASTEVGITPSITTPGSDIDTFFQPSGETITSGTRGHVRLRSFSIRHQLAFAEWRGWTFDAAMGYRRAAMDFLPSDRIVTRSQPASETREPVPGHEDTWSNVLAWGVTAARPMDLGKQWRLSVELEALPLTRARLSVSLPDKYPGEIIRADAFGFGARTRLAAERRTGRLRAGAAATLGGVWGYRSSVRYREARVGGDLFVTVPIG